MPSNIISWRFALKKFLLTICPWKYSLDDLPLKIICRKTRMICLRANSQENILRANLQENIFEGKSSRDYVWGQIFKRLWLRANRQENLLEGKSSRDYVWGQIFKGLCSRVNRQENMFMGESSREYVLKAYPLDKIFTKNSRRIL